jgi:hypothetical protein
MKMSQSKTSLNSYTLTLKIQPYSALWTESGERVSFMNKFSTWIGKFHTPMVELTNCSLLMDSKYVESKNKSSIKKIHAQNFVGAVITFKAPDEDLVCEWMNELPTSNKYSWNFEILKSCELFISKGF